MGRLDGKVAVITGGASGMGLATVERFVAEGAAVVLTDLQAASHDELVDRIGEEQARVHYRNREKDGPNDGHTIAERLGASARFVAADVTVADQLAEVIDTAVREFGGLDILFNNAGVGGAEGSIVDCDEAVYDRVLDVDLKAVWRGIKLGAPRMIERGGGSIISTSSGAGLMGIPGLAAYSAAKGGVIAMTRTAAMELAPHKVRVNCICPGGIVTPILYQSPLLGASIDPDTMRAMLGVAHPIARAGEPEDIANAALWLASDDSSFVTGQAIAVDGGLSAEADARIRGQIVTAPRQARAVVKFGLIYEICRPDPDWATEAETYHQALEQCVLAEEVGFDHVWAVEHHFLENYSLSSAPDVFLSAVAQRTERIRIGHGVRLLPPPFNHPARSASSAAVLDILSNGRLEFGVGRSITEQELGGFGIDPSASRPMLEEVLPEIVKMWTQPTYEGHEGEHFSMPPRVVQPKPMQDPHPPLWMACTQPTSFELAADFGAGALAFGLGLPGDLAEAVQVYKARVAEPRRQAGHFVNGNIAAAGMMFCAEDEAKARSMGGAAQLWYAANAAALFAPWAIAEVPGYEYYHQLARDPSLFEAASLKQRLDDGLSLVGTPEKVLEGVRRYEDLGVDQLICIVQVGRVTHEDICESLRLFGDTVIDEVRQAVA